MRNNLLKSLLVGVALFSSTASLWAEEFTLSPSEATVIDAGNADQNFYDATATTWNVSQSAVSNGAFKNYSLPVLLAKFDGSSTLAGLTVTKATLSFNAKCTVSNKNSSLTTASISTDWDASTATWNATNSSLNATVIDEGTWSTKNKTTAFTIDVTELLQNDEDKVVGFGICTSTAREHTISDLVLTVEAIDASASANYTVKFVDESGNEIKTAASYTESIGNAVSLKDADKASIYSEDGTKKYIYVSDDSDGKTVESGDATVVTVTFREAATWSYSYNAVDADNNVLAEGIVKGTNFEGETFNVGIPTYLNIDGTLYETGKTSSDGKGYYKSFTLSEDNIVNTITYSATETTGIVYLSEAENIEGLTKATNSNTGVRSSNGASAYADSVDVVFTTLPAGKYKLTTVICDASGKTVNSTWNFIAGTDTIFSYTATAVNWAKGTSDEFTLAEETPIALGKGGDKNKAVDIIYIQKTGEYVPAIDSIANIGALKDLADSTDVIVTLKDAKVTMMKYYGRGYQTYVEDATGAVMFDGDLVMSLSEIGLYSAGMALNGTLCAKYVIVDGIPTLATADSTGTMTNVTAEETTVVPTETTVADAKKAESLSRYIVIKGAEMTGDVADVMYAIQDGDTIQVIDQYWSLEEGFEVPAKADSIIGVVTLVDSVYTIYPEKIVADASADTFAVVNSIAEMKALGDNVKVELKLNGATVISIYNAQWGFNDIYLEDGTGAVMIDPEAQYDEPFANMVNKSSVSGSLFVKYIGSSEDTYFMDMPTIYATTKTAESELTITEADAIAPIAMTIAEASTVENAARYVKLTDLTTVDGGYGTCTASQGEASIDVVDSYFQIVTEETVKTYAFPTDVESLTGIIFYDGGTFSLFPFDVDGNSPIVEKKADGINTVKAGFDAKAGKVYNLNGQRVMNPTKGLYIQNGKKVIVK